MFAEITVAAYWIPQCMLYAELADVQPIVGLLQLQQANLVNLIGQERIYPTLYTAIEAFHARHGLI